MVYCQINIYLYCEITNNKNKKYLKKIGLFFYFLRLQISDIRCK